NGSFAYPWTWHSTSIGWLANYQQYFADVNGDGKVDWIQVTRGSNDAWVGLGNGDGSFTTWTWHSATILSANSYQHFFADVNGDGKADWIQVAQGFNNAWVGLADGNGGFTTWTWSSTTIGAGNSYAHFFADVNGDGRADWIQVAQGTNDVWIGLS